jgi:hypothetical protein
MKIKMVVREDHQLESGIVLVKEDLGPSQLRLLHILFEQLM